MNARYSNQKEVLTVHVVDRDGPELMVEIGYHILTSFLCVKSTMSPNHYKIF